jgi:hypothetical protein
MELPRYPSIPPIELGAAGDIMILSEPIQLGAEPEEPERILFEGFPLADLGLKRALVEYPDGSRVPLWGFCIKHDETLLSAIARTIGSGKLVNDAGEELILPDLTQTEALQISLSRR